MLYRWGRYFCGKQVQAKKTVKLFSGNPKTIENGNFNRHLGIRIMGDPARR